MQDKNTNIDKRKETIIRYCEHFGTEEVPMLIMTQSEGNYISELEAAIKKNVPIDKSGKGRPERDIVEQER